MLKRISIIMVLIVLLSGLFACEGNTTKTVKDGADLVGDDLPEEEEFVRPQCYGYFMPLEDAYIQQQITEEDAKDIAYYFDANSVEPEFTPITTIEEELSETTIENIKNTKAYDISYNGIIPGYSDYTYPIEAESIQASEICVRYLGTYANYIAVEIKKYEQELTGEIVTDTVGSVTIEHDSSLSIELYKSNDQKNIRSIDESAHRHDIIYPFFMYLNSEKTEMRIDEECVIKYIYYTYEHSDLNSNSGIDFYISQTTFDKSEYYTKPIVKTKTLLMSLNYEDLEPYCYHKNGNSFDVIYSDYLTLTPDLFSEEEGGIEIRAEKVYSDETGERLRMIGRVVKLYYRKEAGIIYFYESYKDYLNDIRK